MQIAPIRTYNMSQKQNQQNTNFKAIKKITIDGNSFLSIDTDKLLKSPCVQRAFKNFDGILHLVETRRFPEGWGFYPIFPIDYGDHAMRINFIPLINPDKREVIKEKALEYAKLMGLDPESKLAGYSLNLEGLIKREVDNYNGNLGTMVKIDSTCRDYTRDKYSPETIHLFIEKAMNSSDKKESEISNAEQKAIQNLTNSVKSYINNYKKFEKDAENRAIQIAQRKFEELKAKKLENEEHIQYLLERTDLEHINNILRKCTLKTKDLDKLNLKEREQLIRERFGFEINEEEIDQILKPVELVREELKLPKLERSQLIKLVFGKEQLELEKLNLPKTKRNQPIKRVYEEELLPKKAKGVTFKLNETDPNVQKLMEDECTRYCANSYITENLNRLVNQSYIREVLQNDVLSKYQDSIGLRTIKSVKGYRFDPIEILGLNSEFAPEILITPKISQKVIKEGYWTGEGVDKHYVEAKTKSQIEYIAKFDEQDYVLDTIACTEGLTDYSYDISRGINWISWERSNASKISKENQVLNNEENSVKNYRDLIRDIILKSPNYNKMIRAIEEVEKHPDAVTSIINTLLK